MDPSEEALIEPSLGAGRKPEAVFGLPLPKKTFSSLLKDEYYDIVENPKRLPFFFHPIFGREREFSITGKRTFFTHSFLLADKFNVHRRLYINFEAENIAVGATGGLLMGLATKQYFHAHGALAQRTITKNWLKHVETGQATKFQNFVYGSIVSWRVAKRLVLGAVLYDSLKRSAEMKRDEDDWLNAACAGAVCGTAFGLRGGLPTAILGGFGFSLGAILHHIFPGFDSVT